MDLAVKDKTAIVTGGTGAIGQGIVLAFAEEGANVLIASRDLATGDALARRARDAGLPGRVVAVSTDVADRASVDTMLARCHTEFGPADVLVNNAGGPGGAGAFENTGEAQRRWEMSVNVHGVVNCCQAVAADMLDQRAGAIINISSDASRSGMIGQNIVHYSGVKGFVNSFSKALAWEWAKKGVRVNTISPAWIVPESRKGLGEGSYWNGLGFALNGEPEDMQQRMEDGALARTEELPIPRLGRPEDVANLCLFLASDRAGYITGQLISVSGGAYMP